MNTESNSSAKSHATSQSRDFWETHYAGMDPGWGTRPNVVVAELIETLTARPGRALDLGCGHGGDALWLAARGWQVTATDVAQAALDRVDAGAQAQNVEDLISTERHDLSQELPTGSYDLIVAAYFHTPIEINRDEVLRRASRLLAPGGLLIVVDHASTPPWSWNAGKDITFPTPHETLEAIDLDGLAFEGEQMSVTGEWTVERCEAPERTATGPSGENAVVTDNIIAVRRTVRAEQ